MDPLFRTFIRKPERPPAARWKQCNIYFHDTKLISITGVQVIFDVSTKFRTIITHNRPLKGLVHTGTMVPPAAVESIMLGARHDVLYLTSYE